jgi:hypothetical protein
VPKIFSFTADFVARSEGSKFYGLRVELASLRKTEMDSIFLAHGLSNSFAFAFTASSILVSGGHPPWT